jgi:MFS family permease
MQTSIRALGALNFFMADVRDGLGPFLGVYLQSQQWSPGQIGIVMTIGGLAGVAATTPAGVLVDRSRAKRSIVVVSALAIVLASLVMLFVPALWMTAGAQVVNGIAAALLGPAIAGITLGLVRQSGFAHQLGRNEALNHAGNVASALLAGVFGYVFGIGAVFVVMSAMALAAIVATWFIDPAKIDYAAARGGTSEGKASGFSVLLTCAPLLVVAATMLLFHLGNAAMLPLLGQAMVAAEGGDPSATTGATIVIAQIVMVPVALLAARMAVRQGYWNLFLLALIALPIRCAVAAALPGMTGLVLVQILDGVGAGLLGVAVPGLVARILDGTGHVNAGLGAVMTMQGIGAALSPALGGVVAEKFGYQAAFVALGIFAALALVVWLAARPLTSHACSGGTIMPA